MSLFAEGARRIRVAFQAPVGDHDAFGYGLFRRSEQALVEPDGMRARNLVQAVSDFRRVESSAQHLGSQHADAPTNWTGGKDFLNHLAIVVDRHIEILSVER